QSLHQAFAAPNIGYRSCLSRVSPSRRRVPLWRVVFACFGLADVQPTQAGAIGTASADWTIWPSPMQGQRLWGADGVPGGSAARLRGALLIRDTRTGSILKPLP